MIGLQRVISVGRLYLDNGTEDEQQDMKRVNLKCTGCSLRRSFPKGEIPDRFRDGCPNCGSRFAVDWTITDI